MNKVSKWIKKWNFQLNVAKTYRVIISKGRIIKNKLFDKSLQGHKTVQAARHLGMILDQQLN